MREVCSTSFAKGLVVSGTFGTVVAKLHVPSWYFTSAGSDWSKRAVFHLGKLESPIACKVRTSL